MSWTQNSKLKDLFKNKEITTLFYIRKAGKFPSIEYNVTHGIPIAVLTIAEKYSRSSTNKEEEEEEDHLVH
jgi:hypothetical protein